MSMPTTDEFINIVKRKKNNAADPPVMKLAKVTAIQNGKAVIQFDEDSRPSQKIYRALKSYSPVIGDRVILINGIIFGGWKA